MILVKLDLVWISQNVIFIPLPLSQSQLHTTSLHTPLRSSSRLSPPPLYNHFREMQVQSLWIRRTWESGGSLTLLSSPASLCLIAEKSHLIFGKCRTPLEITRFYQKTPYAVDLQSKVADLQYDHLHHLWKPSHNVIFINADGLVIVVATRPKREEGRDRMRARLIKGQLRCWWLSIDFEDGLHLNRIKKDEKKR